jgi:hypothetical protein
MKNIKCNRTGKCFARVDGCCTILCEKMTGEKCAFQKPKRDVTNGKRYEMRKM